MRMRKKKNGEARLAVCKDILLSDVNYAGTARDFAKITVENGNTTLTAATLKTSQRY